MQKKNVFYYQCFSALFIGAYFFSVALHYCPATDGVSQITAHLSSAKAASIIFYGCLAVLLYCVAKIILFRKSVPGGVLLADSLLLIFITVNVLLSVFCFSASTNGCYIVSENIVRTDSISGYRYVNGEHRQVYVFRNRKVFDAEFKVNQQGFTSAIDYTKKKSKKGKRWIVLGDSFTSESFNATNWVNRINANLEKDSLEENELFSFSLEGIGARTWHSIFFNQVLPEYEFDGLILPIYFEDIFRDPVVLYENKYGVNCAYPDSICGKITREELNGEQIALKTELQKIDSVIATVSHYSLNAPSLYPALIEEHILPLTASIIYGLNKNRQQALAEALTTDSIISFIEQLPSGSRGINNLREIVSACKAAGKSVIVCSVPDDNVAEIKFSGAINEASMVKAIAQHFGTEYFSGYDCFNFLSREKAPLYFHADGHWNTQGSKIFSDSFYQFLKNNEYLQRDSASILNQP